MSYTDRYFSKIFELHFVLHFAKSHQVGEMIKTIWHIIWSTIVSFALLLTASSRADILHDVNQLKSLWHNCFLMNETTFKDSEEKLTQGRAVGDWDAVTGNEWSLMFVRGGGRTTSIYDDAKRSLHQAWESAEWLSSSLRFGGADLCIHLSTSNASLKSIHTFTDWSCRRRCWGIPAIVALS